MEHFWIAIVATLTFITLVASSQVVLYPKPDGVWHWEAIKKPGLNEISGVRISVNS